MSHSIVSADGSILVRDCNDVLIMYDIALQDMTQLEDELLNVSSLFIKHRSDVVDADDELKTSALELDRLRVLEDIYHYEFAFCEKKRQLMDSYLEAYEHAESPQDQKNLAQIVSV